MAKRKRLGPAGAFGTASDPSSPPSLQGPAPETKAAAPSQTHPSTNSGAKPETKPGAPIASVAGASAAEAALAEVAGELTRAREEGRLIQTIPLVEIDRTYLVRDRVVVADDDMDALRESLRARGQQTPIEVVALPQGADPRQITPHRYGLISGWRRLTALESLAAQTGDARFTTVQARVRAPASAADAYVAMVEENEIRVGLSYFERARVVVKAVDQRVFADRTAALRGLFGAASKAKRSKIGSFTAVVAALDGALAFPGAVGERLGLRLAKALEEDPDLAVRLRAILPGPSAEVELAVLEGALAPLPSDARPGSAPALPTPPAPDPGGAAKPPSSGPPEESPPGADAVAVAPGLWLSDGGPGGVRLHGPALTPRLRADLRAWLEARGAQ